MLLCPMVSHELGAKAAVLQGCPARSHHRHTRLYGPRVLKHATQQREMMMYLLEENSERRLNCHKTSQNYAKDL